MSTISTVSDGLLAKANKSTKWAVLAAHTAAVWGRRDFAAPFVVVGSILSVGLAEVLKRAINQARPEGKVPRLNVEWSWLVMG